MQARDEVNVYSREAVSDEVIAYRKRLHDLLIKLPPMDTYTAAEHRAFADSGKSPFGACYVSPLAQEREVRAAGHGVRVRVIKPDTRPVSGIYLYLHGGGWTLGGAHLQDATLEDIAKRTGWLVVAPHYRLAPEHPLPAAAARWVRDEARRLGGGSFVGVRHASHARRRRVYPVCRGTADPLLDDSLFMHARWQAAGNRSELNVVAGEVHGFFTFDSPSIPAAQARYLSFMQQATQR